MSSVADNRILFAYLCEGLALVGDGVPAAAVEASALELGLAASPLAVIDDLSLKRFDDALHQELHELEEAGAGKGHTPAHDHGHSHGVSPGGHGHDHDHGHDHHHDHGSEVGHDHSSPHHQGHGHDHSAAPGPAPAAKTHPHKVKSERMPESAVYVIEKMAHGFKGLGQSAGGGFYDHKSDGSRSLWSGLKTFERGSRRIPAEDLADRLLYATALEAVRGIGSTGADGDSSGPEIRPESALREIDRIGRERFVERARELASRYGGRFEPPPLLIDKTASGGPW
jgi:hypothetical protein